MSLLTWGAALFVAVTFTAYWLAPLRFRHAVLVVASYVFYAAASPPYALLLAALTVVTWWVGIRIREERSLRWLWAGVALALGVLAWFKYSAMGAKTLNALAGALDMEPLLPVPSFVLPLGLSFVTFSLIHYLVEMRRKEAPAPGIVEFVLYVAFFPTVTTGPIKRYPQFMDDLRARLASPDWAEVSYGLMRIVEGLFRKFVIADSMQPVVNRLFDAKTGPEMLLMAVYAYAIKIYFDFSGYSSIAIGIARLFGFRVIENFDRPYLARNLSQFWRRWHISLTRLITEYVYIPLGGNRRRWPRVVFNTLVAMGLSGLWHGAAWHFVAWGLYHGAGLVVLRWWQTTAKWLRSRVAFVDRAADSRLGGAVSAAFGWFVTFNFVTAGWLLFALPMSRVLEIVRQFASLVLEVV